VTDRLKVLQNVRLLKTVWKNLRKWLSPKTKRYRHIPSNSIFSHTKTPKIFTWLGMDYLNFKYCLMVRYLFISSKLRLVLDRTSLVNKNSTMKSYNNYQIFDIFYNNTNGDQFDQTSLSKEGFWTELLRSKVRTPDQITRIVLISIIRNENC